MKSGDVVLLEFPFSDLSGSKLRPAVLIAAAGRDEFIACQVTSQEWDERAIAIDDDDFVSGGLKLPSRVRPAKLFTADRTLIEKRIGRLKAEVLAKVKQAVINLIEQ